MFHTITTFIKKENVLCIAALLAVISMFFVPPSSCLPCLYRLSCSGAPVLPDAGSCRISEHRLLSVPRQPPAFRRKGHPNSMPSAYRALLFFFHVITNDVALITFVPFAVLLFSMAEQTSLLIPVIVLQTIACQPWQYADPCGESPDSICILHFPSPWEAFYCPCCR